MKRWFIFFIGLLIFSSSNLFAENYYWVGQGIDSYWGTLKNWSKISGGDPEIEANRYIRPPTSGDNVIFDENSFTINSTEKRTVTINTTAVCDSVIFRNCLYSPILTFTSNMVLQVYGSLILQAGMTFGNNNGTIEMRSIRANESITPNGTIIHTGINIISSANFTVNGHLLLYFLDIIYPSNNLTHSGNGDLTVNGGLTTFQFIHSGNGNLTINDDVSVYQFNFAGNGNLHIDGSLTASSSAISISGSGTKIINGNIFASRSNISISGSGTTTINGNVTFGNRNSVSYDNFEISDGQTEVNGDIYGAAITIGNGGVLKVQGHNVTLTAHVSIANGGTLLANGSVFQLDRYSYSNSGWSNNGTLFTKTTAPALIRVNGNFEAKAGDVYNNVEFYSNGSRSILRGVYNKVSFLKGNGDIGNTTAANSITTDSLIIQSLGRFTVYNTNVVNKYLEIKPMDCGGTISLSGYSPTSGTFSIGATGSNAVNVSNTSMTNLEITGNSSPYSAAVSVDNGGNVGWTFTPGAAHDYYWVGGTGNWSDISHWANVSRVPGSGCVPTLFDNVFFDENSGLSNPNDTVWIDVDSYCNDMTWHHISGNTVVRFPLSTNMYIGGSLELNPGMKFHETKNPDNPYSSNYIYFVSNDPDETILSNGVVFPGYVCFDSPDQTGGWTFLDDFQGVTGVQYASDWPVCVVYFQSGSLNFNEKNMTATAFISSSSFTRHLNIANSIISTSKWEYAGTNGEALTSALTQNSVIKAYFAYAYIVIGGEIFAKTGDVYNNVEFVYPSGFNYLINGIISNGIYNKITIPETPRADTYIFRDNIQTDTLLLYAKDATYTLTTDMTVNKFLDTRDCGNPSVLKSDNTTARTITMGSGSNVRAKNLNIAYVNITGATMPGGGYPAENSEVENSTGWDPFYPNPTTYYWVNGTGEWEDASHWSLESGGEGGEGCIPRKVDNVIFDDNSFSAPGQTVSIDIAAYCDSMSWIGSETWKPIFIPNRLYIYGSLKLQRGMSFSLYANNRTVYFRSTRSSESLETAEVIIAADLSFSTSGEWIFKDNVSCSGYGISLGGTTDDAKWTLMGRLNVTKSPLAGYSSISLGKGYLDSNGQAISVFIFSGSGRLNIRNSDIVIYSSTNAVNAMWNFSGTIVDSENSNIHLRNYNSASSNFRATAGQVYNNVFFESSSTTTNYTNTPSITNGKYNKVVFKGNGTINNIETDTLQFRPGFTYNFTSNATSTINKTWYGSGDNCNITTIKSTTPGTKAKISVAKEAATLDPDIYFIDFVQIKDLQAVVGTDRAILRKGPRSEKQVGGYGAADTNTDWILDDYLGSTDFHGLGGGNFTVNLHCNSYPYTLTSAYFVPNPESTYEWRKGSNTTASNPIIGNQPTFTVNSPEEEGIYSLKVNYLGGINTPCSLDDSLKIMTSGDSLIWIGAVNTDWNDFRNWKDKDDQTSFITVPDPCTNVLIPAGLARYPILTPLSGGVGTDYSTEDFPMATCNHIWFAHGGEVVRTDSLHYTAAYVDLQIQSNQWYMLSAPLQNMYTGDFYEKSPNPFQDGFDGSGLFIEPMYFNVENPQTGKKTASFKWTGTFNGADSLLRAGQGLALWAGDSSPLYTHHQDVLFRFPKSDIEYKYYYTNGTETGGFTSTLDRKNKNRFIYEPTINKTDGATYGDVPLYTSPVANPGEPILVGNPFMAHLKFDEFVALNFNTIKSEYEIEDEYKLAYDVAPSGTLTDGKVNDFVTYKVVNGTYITTDNEVSGEFNYIAPMQSFIVISKNNNPSLKANIQQTGMVSGPDNKLRSASSTNTHDYLLEITAEQNQQPTSKALLLYMDNASNHYVPAEDSYKLFSENSKAHVLVYLRSSDGYALDINSIGNLEQAVPLGIRTNQKGQIRLKFEGTDKFLDKANIFLHDTKASKVTNMSLYKEYTFNKEEDDLYLENRFYITFNNGSPTGIKGLESASVSIQNPAPQTLQILSNNGKPLGRIQITDSQGRALLSDDIKSSSYTYRVKTSGMYIIRVGSDVKKAIIN